MATTYVRKEYTQSEAVDRAKDAYEKVRAGQPGDYTSRWQPRLDQAVEKLTQRRPFRYDTGSDALYRQYRDQYVTQGRQAMMDTMGRAAALTGGYGNSYAQTAGQQTYQAYLQQLGDRVPELYALALQTYQTEGDLLKDQIAALTEQEGLDYSRYRDSVTDWQTAAEQLYRQWAQERQFDYDRWADSEDAAYDRYRDGVADDRWAQEFAYQKSQDELAYEQWLLQFEEDRRRYDQEWARQLEKDAQKVTGRTGTVRKKETAGDTAAQDFVDRMLAGATGSRFDPQRVIAGTNVLTDEQKEQAQEYLKKVLAEGRMKG